MTLTDTKGVEADTAVQMIIVEEEIIVGDGGNLPSGTQSASGVQW